MSMEQQINRLIQTEIDSGDLAGSALSVIKDGHEVFRHSYGALDIDSGAPMPDNPIFRMYSMSKPVTSAAAMMLIERGVITRSAPVSDYLPAFADQTVWQDGRETPVQRPMTVDDLLNMTSGLSYPDASTETGRRMEALFNEAIARAHSANAWTTLELCERIGRIPLLFQPGARWQYGTSADVLGAVIEVASGRRFGTFLKEELFEPLGMCDTGFYVPEQKRERFATMYKWSAQPPKLSRYTGSHLVILDFAQPPAFESGGAGLVSTLDDYGRFAQMLINGGELNGRRLLKPETVEFMHSARLTPEQQRTFEWAQLRGFTYGNLMRVLTRPEAVDPVLCGLGVKGEYGWDGWAGTYFMADPANRLIIIYLISRIDLDPHPMRAQLKRVIYDNLVK